MIIGILSPIAFIALIIILVIRLRSGFASDGNQGQSVRRFFQYALLFGLVVVVANGLTGLLARLLESSDILVTDQTELARYLSFVVVGVPLFIGIALWIRRQYLADSAEAKAFGWSLYFTLASLTFLIGFTLSLRGVLFWMAGLGDYQSYPLAQFLIWGALWFGHWWANSRLTPTENSRAQHLIGSLYGLVFLVVSVEPRAPLDHLLVHRVHLGDVDADDDRLVRARGHDLALTLLTAAAGMFRLRQARDRLAL